MPEKLFGILAHPLMVHLPVVMFAVCALIALALAIRPSLVQHFGIPLVLFTGVSFIGTFLATESGEGLQDLLGEKSAAIERHAEWGDRTRIAALVFLLLGIAFVLLVKRSQRAAATTSPSTGSASSASRSLVIPVVAVLLLPSAAATTAAVIYADHSGAKSAWEDAGKQG